MKQYIITDEKLQQLLTRQRKSPLGSGHGSEFLSLADWEIATIVDEVYSRPYNPQAEREIPNVLFCQSLPNDHGFCGKNDCFCKELHRVESGDICKWMQENRKREGKDGE
jgi:hypothetical protein